jgi:electron transfer flavoprotein beta subunit
VGLGAAWSSVVSAERRPARTAGEMVKDDGDGGSALADFLVAQRFI